VTGQAPSRPAIPRDDLYYLVHRSSFGFTPELYQDAVDRGYDGWLDRQLDPSLIPDTALDSILAGFPTLGMSVAQLYAGYGPNGNLGTDTEAARELSYARIQRAVGSTRQLYERIVDFWADHLNVPQLDQGLNLLRTVYDREVIREHALGYFPDLLMASAKSAAMLLYLDGGQNVAGAPNENYAREVMELHTLGVDGGYNENDIYELARCLTGWTAYPVGSPQIGEFLFDPGRHDFGSKVVLGQTIPAGGGLSDGETMLNFLALHPTTAEFVSRKLAIFLLDYEPPQELVDAAKATFLSTGGHIKEVVRVILDRRWISRIVPDGTPKLRRPMHFLCGVLRTPGVTITSPDSILLALEILGHRPFEWSAPDGYPDDLSSWGSGVLPRWSFAFAIFGNQFPGVTTDAAAIYNAMGAPGLSGLTEGLGKLIANGNLASTDLAAVESFVQSGAASTGEATLRNALGLLASCPSYQYL